MLQLRRLVSDHEDCLACIPQLREEVRHLAGRARVYIGKGFIQQENLWIVNQGAGQGHPLAHTLRILSHRTNQSGI